ncbi:hypothetical protein Moror_2581 [Moniliophthora roreri MCA 2997]|nr:hypothetical protein Moror_2581 [Moniliophthora roreri MCA 2997]
MLVIIKDSSDDSTTIPWLEEHVRRSRNVPLIVKIECPAPQPNYTSLEPLLGELHRWKHLELPTVNASFVRYLLDDTHIAPLLRSIQLGHSNVDLELICTLSTLAPNLSSLSYSCPIFGLVRNSSIHSAPLFSNLTQLSLDITEKRSTIAILKQCPHLVSAQLNIDTFESEIFNAYIGQVDVEASFVDLAFLTSLTITVTRSHDIWRDYPFDMITSLLTAIVAPTLTSLSFVFLSESMAFKLAEAPLWLAASRSRFTQVVCNLIGAGRLDTFHIERIPLTFDNLLDLLNGMSSLGRLYIEEPTIEKRCLDSCSYASINEDSCGGCAIPGGINVNYMVTDDFIALDIASLLPNLTDLKFVCYYWYSTILPEPELSASLLEHQWNVERVSVRYKEPTRKKDHPVPRPVMLIEM